MAREPGALEITQIWAIDGDADDRTPKDYSDGSQPDQVSTADGWTRLWTGSDGRKPQLEEFNRNFYRLYSLALEINQHSGLLEWDSSYAYKHPCFVVRIDSVSNVKVYISKRDNTAADPLTSTDDWEVWVPGGSVEGVADAGEVSQILYRSTGDATVWGDIDRDVQLWDVLGFISMSRSLI